MGEERGEKAKKIPKMTDAEAQEEGLGEIEGTRSAEMSVVCIIFFAVMQGSILAIHDGQPPKDPGQDETDRLTQKHINKINKKRLSLHHP